MMVSLFMKEKLEHSNVSKKKFNEVKSGFECGLSIKSFNDIKVGDVVESYEQREIKRTLVLKL